MKLQHIHIIFLSSVFLFAVGCGGGKPKENPTDGQVDFSKNKVITQEYPDKENHDHSNVDQSGEELPLITLDTSRLWIDTIFNTENGKIALVKNKLDANHKPYDKGDLETNSLIVLVLRNDTIVMKKEVIPNQFARMEEGLSVDQKYMTLLEFFGGSGYIAHIYSLDTKAEGQLTEVVSYSELGSILISKDKKEMLLMEGFWDMADDSEYHFSDHTYEISVVDLTKDKYERKHIGTTRHKYPSADIDFSEEKLFHLILQKDAQALKGINIDKYTSQ